MLISIYLEKNGITRQLSISAESMDQMKSL